MTPSTREINKIAQIPIIRHLSSRQGMQNIKNEKINAHQTKLTDRNSKRKYKLPLPPHPKQLKDTKGSYSSPTPMHNKGNSLSNFSLSPQTPITGP
jgi:hypothetical protein